MAALGLACRGWASLDRAVPLETTVENGDVRSVGCCELVQTAAQQRLRT